MLISFLLLPHIYEKTYDLQPWTKTENKTKKKEQSLLKAHIFSFTYQLTCVTFFFTVCLSCVQLNMWRIYYCWQYVCRSSHCDGHHGGWYAQNCIEKKLSRSRLPIMFNWCSAGSAVQRIEAYLLIAIIFGLACEVSRGVCPATSHWKSGKMCYNEDAFFSWCISPASCGVEKKKCLTVINRSSQNLWCMFAAGTGVYLLRESYVVVVSARGHSVQIKRRVKEFSRGKLTSFIGIN